MSRKGNADNGILRDAHFELKLNIPPIYFFSLYIHHLTLRPLGTPSSSRTSYLSKPFPPAFFKHNFYRPRPHFHILVAFEFDQRQDGSTFLFPS